MRSRFMSIGLATLALAVATSSGAAFATTSPVSPPSPGVVEVPPALHVGDKVPSGDGSFSFSRSGVTTLGARPALASVDSIISPQWTYAWNFTADFKASLDSSKFNNVNNAEIKVESVNVTNCTSGYPTINIQLVRVNSVGVVTWHGVNASFPCGGYWNYSWGAQPNAGYQLWFSRSGPTSLDENTKHVTGTAYYG